MPGTPFTPVGNSIITSASTSIYAMTIPEGMASGYFWIANLNGSGVALINFVTVSATVGEGVQNIPVIAFDTQVMIIERERRAFFATGATVAVMLIYPQLR